LEQADIHKVTRRIAQGSETVTHTEGPFCPFHLVIIRARPQRAASDNLQAQRTWMKEDEALVPCCETSKEWMFGRRNNRSVGVTPSTTSEAPESMGPPPQVQQVKSVLGRGKGEAVTGQNGNQSLTGFLPSGH
jgi:hypothetical protein